MTIVEAARFVTGGIPSRSRPTTRANSALLAWFEAFGDLTKVGVEGSGSRARSHAGCLL